MGAGDFSLAGEDLLFVRAALGADFPGVEFAAAEESARTKHSNVNRGDLIVAALRVDGPEGGQRAGDERVGIPFAFDGIDGVAAAASTKFVWRNFPTGSKLTDHGRGPKKTLDGPVEVGRGRA